MRGAAASRRWARWTDTQREMARELIRYNREDVKVAWKVLRHCCWRENSRNVIENHTSCHQATELEIEKKCVELKNESALSFISGVLLVGLFTFLFAFAQLSHRPSNPDLIQLLFPTSTSENIIPYDNFNFFFLWRKLQICDWVKPQFGYR